MERRDAGIKRVWTLRSPVSVGYVVDPELKRLASIDIRGLVHRNQPTRLLQASSFSRRIQIRYDALSEDHIMRPLRGIYGQQMVPIYRKRQSICRILVLVGEHRSGNSCCCARSRLGWKEAAGRVCHYVIPESSQLCQLQFP